MTDQQRQAAGEDSPAAKLCSLWQARIKRARDLWDDDGKAVRTARKYVSGKIGDDGKGGLVRANLILAILSSMLPRVYAKAPEIAVTPAESTDESQYPVIRAFAKTATIVLQRLLVEEGNLKKRGKAAVRAAMTSRIGWLKLSYQRDIAEDPIIRNRIADTQDNIRRIEGLMRQIEDEQQRCDHEAKVEELRLTVDALEQQVEVVAAEGLALDLIKREDLIVDPDVEQFDDYVNARWIAHRIWYDADEFETTFSRKPTANASVFGKTQSRDETIQATDDQARYAVYEIWHRQSNQVLTLCDGEHEWLREPYSPKRLGQRWYPFFGLAFNPIDGRFEPISDVELLQELQDEFNENRTQLREHRKISIPHWIADAQMDEKSLVRKQHAELGEIVLVDTNGRPLREVFEPANNPPVNPAVYDVSPVRSDMEMVAGMGDANTGTVSKAKTATEAEYLAEAMASRTQERQDVVEDLIQEMAEYALQIALQELTVAQVQTLAGANAVWPKMQREQVYHLVQVEIRSGTSGKPNRLREQDQWIKFLPLIQDLIAKVDELRIGGREDTAKSVIALARETLRRFDERIDIEEFLPQGQQEALPPGGQAGPSPGELAMAQQEQERARQDAQAEADRAKEIRIAEINAGAEVEKARLAQPAPADAALEQALQAIEQLRQQIGAMAQAGAQAPAELHLHVDPRGGVTKKINFDYSGDKMAGATMTEQSH